MRIEPIQQNAPISVVGERVHVEEAWSYSVQPEDGAEWTSASAFFGDRQLAPCGDGASFLLEVPHLVGEVELTVNWNGGPETQRVVVEPRSEKISQDAWVSLLEDLDRWVPGSTIGQEEVRHGAVGRRGTEFAAISEALSPLIPALVHAFRAVADCPRLRQLRIVDFVEAQRVRRVDAHLTRHVTRNLAAAQTVGLVTGGAVEQARFPQPTPRTDLEHPANRYVAWAMWRIGRRLGALAEWFETKGRADAEHAWWVSRGARLHGHAREVAAALRRSPLRNVRRASATEAALLSILDDPAYARFHRIARLFLSPRFSLEATADSIGAATRPSFELYEYWCFEVLAQRLSEALGGWTRKRREFKTTDKLLGIANRSAYAFTHADRGALRLTFNPTFPSRPEGSADRYSITRERRPDLTVNWSPSGGEGAWLALDAKYRVSRENILDAFASCHIYRDSLRWPEFGGRPAACVLLSPARSASTAPWFEPEFRDRHAIGAFRVTPGSNRRPGAEVAAWVLEALRVNTAAPGGSATPD